MKHIIENYLKEDNQNTNVIDLIKNALDEAMNGLDKIYHENKTMKIQKQSSSILDVDPLDLSNYMKQNDIPNSAYFSGVDNGYDGYNDIVLEWLEDVPMPDEEKNRLKRERFRHRHFKYAYDKLTNAGYKRISVGSQHFKKYDKHAVYDMYVEGDYDGLYNYYSLQFDI